MRSMIGVLLSLLITTASWIATPSALAYSSYPQGSLSRFSSSHAIVMSLFSFAGTRPTNLGVKAGQLAACPSTPNCVSSQIPSSDKEHSIAPLTYSGDGSVAMNQLKTAIEGMERTKIISAEENYIYAEFTSRLMGFVDDVEFFLDSQAEVIHVRSASRLGESDLGVNRNRIEAIRAALS